MIYVFDGEIAKKYGVDEAIFLQNLLFWIAKNKANNRHEYNGRYWTYNSQEALMELFSFWTRNQIRRIIASLLNKGAIITDQHLDKRSHNMTWYAVSDTALLSGEKAPLQLAETTRYPVETHQTLVETHQTSYTDIYTDKEPYRRCVVAIEEFTKDTDLQQALSGWLEMRKAKKKPLTDRALKLALNKLESIPGNKVEIVNESIINCWTSFYPLKQNNNGKSEVKPLSEQYKVF